MNQRDLADEIFKLAPDVGRNVEMLWAVVTGINAGPPSTLTIRLFGSTVDVPGVRHARSYTPNLGDTVYGRIVSTDYLVEGALA